MSTSGKGRRRHASPGRTRLLVVFAAAVILAGGGAMALDRGGGLLALVGGNGPVREAVMAEAPDLASVYEARKYRPIWLQGDKVRPEAHELIAMLETADRDGLDPADYQVSQLRQDLISAESGEPAAQARFEAEASRAFVDYVADLHQPSAAARMIYTDAASAPPAFAGPDVLQAAADAPSLHAHLIAVRRMNPIYEGLRGALADYRSKKGAKTADQTQQLILLNMDRARALPANPGPRYIVVDAAAATLWMYQDGRPIDSMKVVVGKPSEPTPIMAGMLRYALFNPYWNVPEDLVQQQWAPLVASQGPAVMRARDMEALSDWSPNASVLDPAKVNWSAVAAGRQALRMRQRPGPDNMMGRVKFMLPNELGIYLHDTPRKALFSQDGRFFSSGCVRLEDAPRLARWLFGDVPQPSAADYRVDLKEPVPVYITYFTVAPAPSGVTFRQDIYGRDETALASIQRRSMNLAA